MQGSGKEKPEVRMEVSHRVVGERPFKQTGNKPLNHLPKPFYVQVTYA